MGKKLLNADLETPKHFLAFYFALTSKVKENSRKSDEQLRSFHDAVVVLRLPENGVVKLFASLYDRPIVSK